jgi:ribosomal protein S18 acetylase RimI-like enzyme
MSIEVRKATEQDIYFIASIILLAESTGYELTTYAKMFNTTNDELLSVVAKMITNDSDGHPLCWRSYFIACYDGVPAGALSAYVEGEMGDSNHLMTGALMSTFSREQLKTAFQFLALYKDIQLKKNNGVLQIDCVATLENYSGKGVFGALLGAVERHYSEKGIKQAEIQVWLKNKHAFAVYENKGYKIIAERISQHDQENGKILMQKEL